MCTTLWFTNIKHGEHGALNPKSGRDVHHTVVYQVKHGEHGDERWVTHLGNVTDHEAPWKQVDLSHFLSAVS